MLHKNRIRLSNKLPREVPKFSHLILLVSIFILIVALIWAAFAKIDEVTHADGKVIPSTQVQIIQNLEGGIVKEIYVKEGQVVKKGQILLRLDPTRYKDSYQENYIQSLSLKAHMDRLTAELNNKPYIPDPELMKQVPDYVTNELGLYASRQKELLELNSNLDLAVKELNMTKPLVAEGAASEVEVLRQERQVSELKGQIDSFRTKTFAELNETKQKYNEAYQSMLSDQDRMKRTDILAPVYGVVKLIKITTVGGVSQPGADIMEIVPLEDTLLIEARILPKDIGFIHAGQPAVVKITAFDYSIYGGLNGIVEKISADTILDEKGNSFYLVRVRTMRNFLGKGSRKLYIIPGMTATVDILTGKKTVLDYLLKPIYKAREEALKER